MQRISCKTSGLLLVLAVALVGGVQAQQHQEHHRGMMGRGRGERSLPNEAAVTAPRMSWYVVLGRNWQ
jgi:hypothetical protein